MARFFTSKKIKKNSKNWVIPALLDQLSGPSPEYLQALDQYADGIKRLNFVHKSARLNLDSFASLIKFIKVLGMRRLLIGFVSRGKLNRRKRFWAIHGGPPGVDRNPPRSPIPAFVRSAEFARIKSDFADRIKAEALRYYNVRKEGGRAGSPVSIRNKVFKEFGKLIAGRLRRRRWYSIIQPPLKDGGTPLMKTGKLVASIRSKIVK